MTERLQKAIEQLYTAFSKYPGNPNMQGSPLYSDLDLWNKALFSKPLRELSDSDLSRFSGSVLLTWGDVDDLRHFLPRMLELTAEMRTPYEVWLLFERLNDAGWTNWSEEEQAAIREYIVALWDNLLKDDSEKAEREFDDYFSSLAHFYPNFTDILIIWNNNKGKAPIKHLANYVYNEGHNVFDKGVIHGFCNKTENVTHLQAWLLSEEVINRLEHAYFQYEKEDFAETLSWAEKMLRDELKNAAHNNK